MALMTLDLPYDLNKLLKRYALDNDLGSREKATIIILNGFLKEFYKKELNGN